MDESASETYCATPLRYDQSRDDDVDDVINDVMSMSMMAATIKVLQKQLELKLNGSWRRTRDGGGPAPKDVASNFDNLLFYLTTN